MVPGPLQQVGVGAGRVADVERGWEPSPAALGQVELGCLRRDGAYPGQFLLERDVTGTRGHAEVNRQPPADCMAWASAAPNGSASIRSRNA